MTQNLSYINEPRLSFGFEQNTLDPRDGIMLFGPNSKDKLSHQVNIGVIGPDNARRRIINYLKKIHKPVALNPTQIARPNFPGLEAAFGIHINFKNIPELKVPIKEIKKFLKYKDKHQRIYNLSELYFQRIKEYTETEESPVTVWFIAIPNSIYKYGRPTIDIPKSDDNIQVGLSKSDRIENQINMFFQEENKILRKAYRYNLNFHHQLKAKLLKEKVISQIMIEEKFSYHEMWDDEESIKLEEIFETDKAWNIATSLYYKCGGIPWKLNDVRQNVCYVGLVYKQTDPKNKNSKNACCAAQMFLSDGDGMVFRGNVGPWYNPMSKEYHLNESDAEELISNSLEAFKKQSPEAKYPDEVFIHAKTKFNDEEWQGFLNAVEGKSKIIGIQIRDDADFKLYRNEVYCIPRGAFFKVSDYTGYLWTRGFIPRLQTQIGLEVPNPIQIVISRGKAEIDQVASDILALTKLNYNSCKYGDGVPVTLKFAETIGNILTADKSNTQSKVLPFKYYI